MNCRITLTKLNAILLNNLVTAIFSLLIFWPKKAAKKADIASKNMSNLGLMLTLFTTLVFTSCQVKESVGDGLISGHQPATNKFTLTTPSTNTYVEGETLNLSVSFPFDMTINTGGGNPRLRLTVGATTRYATYVAGANPKVLNFTYTFVAGDDDTNGIDVAALELNGSTLQFDQNGTPTNCDVATITTKNFSGVKVDTTAPTVTAFQMLNLPGLYNAGETLNFRMTFSEAVYVTGSPKFTVTFGSGGPYDVTYLSGSGTTMLNFTYTVSDTDSDINGYNAITSPLVLGGGSLVDVAGNNSSLDFSAYTAAVITYSASVDVVGTYPYVVDVSVPANGTYASNQNLDVVLEFNRAVNVTSTPYIDLTVGTSPSTTTRQAQYLSGTGTKFLTFRYTTVPGDVDADGIAVATTVTQNAGNIRDAVTLVTYFSTGNNTYTVPTTTGILLNAIQPQATSVTRNIDTTSAIWGTALDNKWIIGQQLNITVAFNTGILVGQVGGTPYIPLTIGATSREASYLSGGDGQTSLVFRYIIQEGDLDTDGSVDIGSIVLNGGTMTDATLTNALTTLPQASLTTTQVDGVKPTVSSVSAPANNTYSTLTGNNHVEMQFTINWSEAVNYSATASGAVVLGMDVGGSSTPLQYYSGNNTATLYHRAANLTGLNDSNGVTLSTPLTGTATIRDQAGNTATNLAFTSPVTTAVLVDTTAPTVSSVTAVNANGVYSTGNNLDFTVTFSESVTTSVSGGYPRIPLTIGGSTVYLTPTANTTSTVHTFRYTIVSGEVDTDGISVGNAVTNSGAGYARDSGQNLVTGTFTPPVTTGILVDAEDPTVSSVSVTSNGTYESGDDLSFTITYSEAVDVDTTGGTPRIQATIGSNTRNFSYASGTGTTTLVFTYTLTSNDFDPDGLPSSITTLDLNSGTIEDAGGTSVPTTFTAQNLSSIFVTYPNTRLWVQNNFVSLARSGSPTVSNSGAVTTEACGGDNCRTFDGDDALNLTSALNNVETIYMVVRLPLVVANHDIFSTDINLVNDTTFFELSAAGGDIYVDGVLYTGNSNLSPGAVHIIQVDFAAPENFGASALIATLFNGAIGEVMAISGTLTAPQKSAIQTYLQGKY